MTLTAQHSGTDVERARQRAQDVLLLVYRDGLGAIFSSAYAAPAQRMLARGLDMPEAVRQGLAHADSAIAASFLPGMGRRIPNRIPPQ